MARHLKIAAAVLNVRLHPHPDGIYQEWITALFRGRIIAPIHGDRHGIISMVDSSDSDDGYITGIITTFVRIEEDGTWFNVEEMEVATDNEVSKVYIPDHLYPNASAFYFQLDIRRHRLYFQTYSNGKRLTPLSALRFFSALAKNLKIIERFGEASISIVQARTSIERMFDLEVIKRVEIILMRPNNDVFDDDLEKNVEEHLNRTNAQQMRIVYTAQDRKSIKRDGEMSKLTSAAVENGSVTVVGRDEKGAVTLNSAEYPQEFHDQYDPDTRTERDAFHAIVPHRTVRR